MGSMPCILISSVGLHPEPPCWLARGGPTPRSAPQAHFRLRLKLRRDLAEAPTARRRALYPAPRSLCLFSWARHRRGHRRSRRRGARGIARRDRRQSVLACRRRGDAGCRGRAREPGACASSRPRRIRLPLCAWTDAPSDYKLSHKHGRRPITIIAKTTKLTKEDSHHGTLREPRGLRLREGSPFMRYLLASERAGHSGYAGTIEKRRRRPGR